MKKFKDERLNMEMNEMQAKLFRYLLVCFSVTFLLKLYMLSDYTGYAVAIDYFLLISTAMYAGYLEVTSPSDFYKKSSITKAIISAIVVGLIVTIIPLRENGFNTSSEYLLVYLITFLNGVLLYAITHFIVTTVKRFRHKQIESSYDEN